MLVSQKRLFKTFNLGSTHALYKARQLNLLIDQKLKEKNVPKFPLSEDEIKNLFEVSI